MSRKRTKTEAERRQRLLESDEVKETIANFIGSELEYEAKERKEHKAVDRPIESELSELQAQVDEYTKRFKNHKGG